MKLVVMIAITLLTTDPRTISRINSLKSEAKKAFQSGDYKAASDTYKILVDSMGVKEDAVLLNLAHALYLQKDTARAFTQYQALMQSQDNDIASRAGNQLGLMTNQRGKSQEALAYFKNAVKANPSNQEARYNYEMLKKKLDDQKKKEDQKNNKNDQNKQEPSEFAKKLKAQADNLVAQRRYREAYDLLMDGMKKDQTISSYQTFIDRTKNVAEIDQ